MTQERQIKRPVPARAGRETLRLFPGKFLYPGLGLRPRGLGITRRHGARRSVVEHSLGKGEVVSSILTGSTRKTKQIKHFCAGALPFPPALNRERNLFPPLGVGENWGTLFYGCSAPFHCSVSLVAFLEMPRR